MCVCVCVCVFSYTVYKHNVPSSRQSGANPALFFLFSGRDNISWYYLLAAILMSRTNGYDYRLWCEALQLLYKVRTPTSTNAKIKKRL